MCEADIGKQNGHNTLYNAKQSKVDRFFTGGNIFLLFSDSTVLVINPRTYMQMHTPTVVQVGVVDGPPSGTSGWWYKWVVVQVGGGTSGWWYKWVVALLGGL